jgi:hypothetical protein
VRKLSRTWDRKPLIDSSTMSSAEIDVSTAYRIDWLRSPTSWMM